MLSILSLAQQVPPNIALKFIFGPPIELYDCYAEMVKKHHIDIGIVFRVMTVLLGIVIGGIILPLESPAFANFLNNIIPTTISTGVVKFYCGAWIISYPSSWIASTIVALNLKYWYGDSKYYLDTKRLSTLSAQTHETSTTINNVFNYLRSSYGAGITTIDPHDGSLKKLLGVFMYADPAQVTSLIQYYNLYYEASLLEQGNSGYVERNEQKINALAKIYRATPQDIATVLIYCLDGIRTNRRSHFTRAADYANIMNDILSKSLLGRAKFIHQQKSIKEQRLAFDIMYKQNHAVLAELQNVENNRKAPRSNEEPDIENQRISMNAQELLAAQILQNVGHELALPCGDGVCPLTNEVLAQLIEYFKSATIASQAALDQLPEEAIIQLIEPAHAAELLPAINILNSSAVLFRPNTLPIRTEATTPDSDTTYHSAYETNTPTFS